MKDNKPASQYEEGRQLLFLSSLSAIPFNGILGAILAGYLTHNGFPVNIALIWWSVLVFISIIRIIHCKIVISHELYKSHSRTHLNIFLVLCQLTGAIWGAIYFLAIFYTTELQTYVVLLVLGGMSAASTASLAAFLPAFFAFTLSIFGPVVVYNYLSWEFNHASLASIFLFFQIGISLIAKSNEKVLTRLFVLTAQNTDLIDKLETLSITDSLTGLYNRRYFNQILQEEHNRAKRNHQPFVLVSIDIDNFKLINDNLGHTFGDHFLTYFSDYLKHYLQRANDIIFRIGGDEFAVLLLNTTEENAKSICNKIKTQFQHEPGFKYDSEYRNSKKILEKITLSMGMVYVPYDSTFDLEQIIEKADQMLYEAKNKGKNQIQRAECI